MQYTGWERTHYYCVYLLQLTNSFVEHSSVSGCYIVIGTALSQSPQPYLPDQPNLQQHRCEKLEYLDPPRCPASTGKGRTHYGRPVRKAWFQSLGVVQTRPTCSVGSEPSALYLAPFPPSTWRRRCILRPKNYLPLACDDGQYRIFQSQLQPFTVIRIVQSWITIIQLHFSRIQDELAHRLN
jgi:hypothetical protein